MVELFLLAQLAGPWCGQYGIDPQTSPYVGCTVPSTTDPYGTRLRYDPLAPGGIRASPTGPPPLPTYTQPSQPIYQP